MQMATSGKEGVSDIAYEDAAEPLQALRERMDAEAAAAIPEVWELAQECVRTACKAVDSGAPGPNSSAAGDAGTSNAGDADDGNESGLGGALCSCSPCTAYCMSETKSS